MSEFIATMDASGGAYVGEHSVRRVIGGDIELVRRRLAGGLEALGYTVLSENPLQARREKLKGCLSADFTEHQRRLSVLLRPSSETSTTAVFDFTVVHAGVMTKGDRRTLEREVDAIIALAEAPGSTGVCRSCGTENGGDARFCRLCGAPGTAVEPAELEVLRLTAGARAALQELVGGLSIALLTLVGTLLMMQLGNTKVAKAGFYILIIGEFIGWLMALYGLLRLYRTINTRTEKGSAEAAAALPARPRETMALPPSPAPRLSVTEGTTELLEINAFTREKVAVPRERVDTNPFN